MKAGIVITRAGPLVTVQDDGRFGALRHGVSASGPMDRGAWKRAGLGSGAVNAAGIEFASAGFGFRVYHACRVAFEGGDFRLAVNGLAHAWPGVLDLEKGDEVDVVPGPAGNYGYARFDRELDVPAVLGSRATNTIVRLGGVEGRALRAGDHIELLPSAVEPPRIAPPPLAISEPMRIIWGRHAEIFSPAIRDGLLNQAFRISPQLDRMGVRLHDPAAVFGTFRSLSLVSDAVVAGDIQILGDGTPIVLMRDHQPTGGYPRIATIASADLDRFAQLRPGAEVRFVAVSVRHAQSLMTVQPS